MFVPTLDDENIRRWGEVEVLLEKLRPGQVIVSHLYFSPERLQAIERQGIRSLLMIRDPRDIVVSDAFYISQNKRHPFYNAYQLRQTFKGRLRLAIEGDETASISSIGQMLESFYGWLKSNCLTVCFEDLVGVHGGGEQDKQLSVLRSIYDWIGVKVDDNWIAYLSGQLFSEASPTFRKGTVGQWEQYFDLEMKGLFKRVAGEALIQYGYEVDDRW
jgi:hypothetical protein